MRWSALAGILLLLGPAVGAEETATAVSRFSSLTSGGPIVGWEPLTFPGIAAHTRYELVQEAGTTVLRATSTRSASGLIHRVNLRPADRLWLTWRWRISDLLTPADEGTKAGDDYVARIYLVFAVDPDRMDVFERARRATLKTLYGEEPPAAALTYVWSTATAKETIYPNPYTKRVRMIVVESGPAHLHQWREVRRDVVADFRRAFGSDPPLLSGVAVMTDTDNTGGSATAWYGDIHFSSPP